MAAMTPQPQQLVCLYSSHDEPQALELERLFAVLKQQELFEYWSPRHITPGQDWSAAVEAQLARADIILLLISADFVASQDEHAWTALALEQSKIRGARVIPVLLRPALLPPELESLVALPRNRQPITTWKDRDEALLDVVKGVRMVLEYRPPAPLPGSGRVVLMGPIVSTGSSTATATVEVMRAGHPSYPPIRDIFRLNGPPDITFVEPSQFSKLQVELANLGSGLIVEGPSKVGKSTAVKKALASQSPRPQERWIQGMLEEEQRALEALLEGLVQRSFTGHLIVDDFHYLPDALKKKLAIRMKVLADQEAPVAKVTLIGINPVGSSLTQAVPDLAGRFRIVKMDRQKDLKVAELIIKGEQVANVRYRRRDEIINEADGSFYVAQLLCCEAAVESGITRAQETTKDIELGPSDVLESIQEELRARYHDDLRDFAAHDEAPPPRGACLALLWLLSRSRAGDISMQEAIYQFPDLEPAFAWLRASNLQRLFEERPQLKKLLYYNRAAATLSIEDPQLKFYMRRLDWAELARGSGHASVQFHPIDAPIFTPPSRSPRGRRGGQEGGGPSTPSSGPPTPDALGPETLVLHLSDLHFGNEDQASLWYAQLAADLRQQGCERLDALVVSGDIANVSIPEEYAAARIFLERLMGGFGLSPRQVILTPGNHDLSWSLSQDAYSLHKRARYRGPLEEGSYIAHGPDIVEVRDEEAYKERFRHFSRFYGEIKGDDYPLEYERQAIIQHLPEPRLLVLGLNSAWAIDHHFKSRASIHSGALAQALSWFGEHRYPDHLRISVWHHPLTGPGEDRLVDTGFMQQLAVAGFRFVLHGHVHRADNQLYRYDMSAGGRRIDVIGAGTFGAPMHQWTPGYPLQYNLLRLTPGALTVETRCREELTGAWRPDARWLQGPGQDPLPRYTIAI